MRAVLGLALLLHSVSPASAGPIHVPRAASPAAVGFPLVPPGLSALPKAWEPSPSGALLFPAGTLTDPAILHAPRALAQAVPALALPLPAVELPAAPFIAPAPMPRPASFGVESPPSRTPVLESARTLAPAKPGGPQPAAAVFFDGARPAPEVLAEIGADAVEFAGLVSRQHSLPKARESLAAGWDRTGGRLLPKVYMAQDGRVLYFARRARGVEAYVAERGGEKARPAGFIPVEEGREEEAVVAAIKLPGVMAPVDGLGNVIDLLPDAEFDQDGPLIDALRRRGVSGPRIKRIKTLLREHSAVLRSDGDAPAAAPPRYLEFLDGALALAYPERHDRLRMREDYVLGRLRHEAATAALRAERGPLLRLMARPEFPRWRAVLERTYFPALGYSDQLAAEKLALAWLSYAETGRHTFARDAAFGAALREAGAVLDADPGYGRVRALEAAPILAALLDRPAEASPLDDELKESLRAAARDAAFRAGRFHRFMERLGERLRLFPAKAGPGAWRDALDFVERFYRQVGMENSGERYAYTGGRLYSGTSYLPFAEPLPPLSEARPRGADLRASLRLMLSENAAFEDFEDKFSDERPVVVGFLRAYAGPAFPELGALLRRHISPGNVLEEMMGGVITTVPSRFYRTYARWEGMAWDRVSWDFVRGVESQLLRGRHPILYWLHLLTNWQPFDFGDAADAELDLAVERTLSIGRIRSKKYLKEPRALSEYRFKDLMDAAKRALFMYLPKTKFLRNHFTWNAYFGLGWDCLCWSRESLFRVKLKK